MKGNTQELDDMRKKIIKTFKKLGFRITAECGMKSTDFLDIVLELDSGSYRPYRKPEQDIKYIHVHSNHPKHIKDQIPKMQEVRLSTNSSTQQAFIDAIPPYNEAIAKSGFNHTLSYKPNTNRVTKKKRKGRSILWFNPPFSSEVTTNITRLFLNMLSKHFPHGTELHKILNKNNMKISYCTTQNMKSIVDSHNRKLLAGQQHEDNQGLCNCLKSRKDNCPLQGKCLTKNLVYRADITDTTSNETHSYFGQCMRTFKDTSISTPKKEKTNSSSTMTIREQIEIKKQKSEFAAHVWKLKEGNRPFTIKWHIQKRAFPYTNGAKSCDLCSWENFYILLGDPSTTIKSRSELFFRCKSQRDCLLSNYRKINNKPPLEGQAYAFFYTEVL